MGIDATLPVDRLVRLPEAAGILSISVRTLYRLIAEGKLPTPIKIRRGSRLRLRDLIQFIEKASREGAR